MMGFWPANHKDSSPDPFRLSVRPLVRVVLEPLSGPDPAGRVDGCPVARQRRHCALRERVPGDSVLEKMSPASSETLRTMNDDRHQGAKCPVQDTVGISVLTGGEQHLLGC